MEEAAPSEGYTRPRRIYLLTYPRTASHLLTRILSLDDQPSLSLPKKPDGTTKDGYFFLRMMGERDDRRLWDRDVRDWTVEDRRAMREAFDACARSLWTYAEGVEREGRTAFVKEHVGFMREPVGMSRVLRAERRRRDANGSAGGPGTEEDEDEDEEAPWTANMSAPEPGPPAEFTRSPLNETILPDHFLQTWSPVFLIRHPALAFPSLYRTIRDLEGIDPDSTYTETQLMLETQLGSTRKLYDFYREHFGRHNSGTPSDWPLVVDADDLINTPDVVRRLSDVAGLDSTKLRFTWDTATAEDLAKLGNEGTRRMLDSLSGSTGVIKSKAGSGGGKIDVAAEVDKWKREFGEGEADKLRRWVSDAMDDYEYMRQRRLTVQT